MCLLGPRLAGKVDKDGRLQLAEHDDRFGNGVSGVKLQNMRQQLYDADSAAMVVPGYVVTRQQDGINVELVDKHRRMVSLAAVSGRDWLEELHLLCLSSHMQYKDLWGR